MRPRHVLRACRYYRLLIVVCSSLFVESPLLFAGNCLPFTVYCSLSTDNRLQVAVCCLLTVVRHELYIVRCSQCVVSVHCLLLNSKQQTACLRSFPELSGRSSGLRSSPESSGGHFPYPSGMDWGHFGLEKCILFRSGKVYTFLVGFGIRECLKTL